NWEFLKNLTDMTILTDWEEETTTAYIFREKARYWNDWDLPIFSCLVLRINRAGYLGILFFLLLPLCFSKE
ncbi:hypothetical protein PJI17_32995, partial [Mycobacterium kansasii]